MMIFPEIVFKFLKHQKDFLDRYESCQRQLKNLYCLVIEMIQLDDSRRSDHFKMFTTKWEYIWDQ